VRNFRKAAERPSGLPVTRLDVSELQAVAVIAEVQRRGAVMLVTPGGCYINVFPPGRIPHSLHVRLCQHFQRIRAILLSRAAFGG
jgi:hypothetical protein